MYDFELQADYGWGDGFELVTTEATRAAALRQKIVYEAEAPTSAGKIIRYRVRRVTNT
jgi:hypothetical protein